MNTQTLKIQLPETGVSRSGRPDRWVEAGFDRDGDPCVVLNFDFGACRLQHFLYFDNAPGVKSDDTRQFLGGFGEEPPESFDLAFGFVENYLDRLASLDVDVYTKKGGLCIVGYQFRTNDGKP